MPFTAQIDTEAEWNSIIQYLKTNVVPDSVTKTDRSNFKRRCRQFVLKADPECLERDTLFLKQIAMMKTTLTHANLGYLYLPFKGETCKDYN